MKKTVKIVLGSAIGLSAVLLGVTVFAERHNFDRDNDKNGWVHSTESSASYAMDENAGRSYALIPMEKEKFMDIDAHEYIETVAPILNGYSGKRYTAIIFSDGTGIYYPGSSIENVAFYGTIDESGSVVQELGQITVKGTTVLFTEPSSLQSEGSKNMYQYLPEKYQTDGGSVVVMNDNLYISIDIQPHANVNDAYSAANETFVAFTAADLSQFGSVEIVVNKEFAFLLSGGELILRN